MPRDAIIRPIRAGDKALLERGMRRLSPESARLRFLGPKDHLTLAELRYLTEIDYVDHYAVVAVAPDAELAIAVGDCYQGRGLGTALGEALVEAARTRGIEEFTASILPENLPAQRLFARLSDRMSTHVEHGIYEVVARLSA